jgi:O-acetyl-ADP-ribose deacetylase (regulator of RNase III)
MIIYEGPGDIFCSRMQTVVCPVNTVGVMGAGLALAFKCRVPGLYQAYRQACNDGDLMLGDLFLFKPKQAGYPQILCMPTKIHWTNPSEYDFIERSLMAFVEQYEQLGIQSCCFVKLGCGLGQLSYEDVVRDLMHRHLGNTLPIDIEIFTS